MNKSGKFMSAILSMAWLSVLSAIACAMPRKKKKLVFGAWGGRKYDCNPKALFEYLLKNDNRYECVWLGDESIRDEVLCVPDAKFARKGSFLSFWHCMTASYYVFNISFSSDISGPPYCEQVTLLALGHGLANKCCGRRQFNGSGVRAEVVEAPMDDKKSIGARLSRWMFPETHWRSVASMEEGVILCREFPHRLTMDRILPFGYCRNDYLVIHKNDETLRRKVKERIAKILNIDPGKKWYVYAPTWRHDNSNCYSFLQSKSRARFVEVLRRKNAILIEKHHPKTIECMQSRVTSTEDILIMGAEASRSIDIQEMLLSTDVMISDYSSIYFDFGLLDRPVIEYTYDYEFAKNVDFGFEFDLRDYAPGPFAYTEEELLDWMEREDAEILSQRTERFCKYMEYEQGHACEKWRQFIEERASRK